MTALVYAIGSLGYDFGTYARRDAFAANNDSLPLLTNPDLSNYLVVTPTDAGDVIWTLNLDGTPVYAVRPSGTFAAQIYQKLRTYLVDPNIDLVFATGRLAGSVLLLNGETVPVIEPVFEGLDAWSCEEVVPVAGDLELTKTVFSAAQQLYLSADGFLDWNYWGLSAQQPFNRKLAATLLAGRPGSVQIGNVMTATLPSTATIQTGYTARFMWNDGTPQFIHQPPPLLVDGFMQWSGQTATLTVPVTDTQPRILKLYVRANLNATITATLTGQAQPVSDATMCQGGAQYVDGCYTIAFRLAAPTPNGVLTVTWAAGALGAAGIQATSLQGGMLVRPPALQSFLDRIHFALRNLGSTSSERALNFAATYATTEYVQRYGGTLFASMYARGLQLERFHVERNTTCRPVGDCWDVTMAFFNPANNADAARTLYRAVVDVSQTKPLLLAPVRRWSER